MDKYDFIKRLDNALSPLSEPERESALRYYKELFEDTENETELIEHLGSPEKIAENIIRESGMISNQETESGNFKNTSDSDIPQWKKILNRITQDKALLIITGIFLIILITSLEEFIIPLSIIGAIVAIVFILKNNGDKKKSSSGNTQGDAEEKFNIPENKGFCEKSRDGKDLLLIILIIILTSPVWIGLVVGLFGILVGIIAAVFSVTIAFGAVGIALFLAGCSVLFSPAFAVGILLIGLGLLFTGLVIIAFIPLCEVILRLCRKLFIISIALVHSVFYKREAV